MTPLLSNQLLRTQSDARLTALAAAGHDHAFEAIVERYRKPLSRYLRRLLSEPLAEDVLQATFVRAWQALGSGTGVRDLRPWLYRIAHNQAVNALRAASPAESELSQTMAAPLTLAAPDVAAERSETLRSTFRGIGALPDRQRAALVAVAVDDRPHADVAAELGLSDGALRQLLLRARTALRAAATAVTPYPVVSWLSAGSDASAARVAEVAAGAGGIGVTVKAGAAVLAAGALVAGAPALRDDSATSRATSVTTEQRSPAGHSVTTVDHHGAARTIQAADDSAGRSVAARSAPTPHKATARSGGDHHRSGPSGDDGHSGSGGGDSGDDGHSGSGGEDSGDDGHSGSGGPGSGDDDHHSVPSGSGSSGSGESDSGDSGPSGSGQSGSTLRPSEDGSGSGGGERDGGGGDGHSASSVPGTGEAESDGGGPSGSGSDGSGGSGSGDG
jgi:RNA polymerase sigma factor (sigma-70 family)